jgi:hypothetical protein
MTGRNIFLVVMTVSLLSLFLIIGDDWKKGKVPVMIALGAGFWMLVVKRYWRARKRRNDRLG